VAIAERHVYGLNSLVNGARLAQCQDRGAGKDAGSWLRHGTTGGHLMRINRDRYAELFDPPTGDRIRLGDTSLIVEVERDTTVYGDRVFGGGKTLRMDWV